MGTDPGQLAADAGRVTYEDLTPKQRRRLLVKPLTRASLSTAVLVALYYLLPLSGGLHGSTVPFLGIGLLVFGVLVARQVRSIVESDTPRLRAIEVLFTVFPFFLLIFAAAYFAIAHATPHSFSAPLSRTDALYFTVTVFATVGFGDITATTTTTRLIVTIQMLLDLAILGVGLQLLLSAVQLGLRRRSTPATQDAAEFANEEGPPAD